MVAATTSPASGSSRSVRFWTRTWSMKYFDDAGSTRPASRLTSVSTMPTTM
jgi:hypothetical protein